MTAIMAVIKAVIKPIESRDISDGEKLKFVLIRSKLVAATMVGMARRKENSTADWRLRPDICPPMMLAADLDTPGIMDIDWRIPMVSRFLGFDCSMFRLDFLVSLSMKRRIIPPIKREAMVIEEFPSRYSLTSEYRRTPIMPVGMKAINILGHIFLVSISLSK